MQQHFSHGAGGSYATGHVNEADQSGLLLQEEQRTSSLLHICSVVTPPLLLLDATSLHHLAQKCRQVVPAPLLPALHTHLDQSAQGSWLGWLSPRTDHLHYDLQGLQSSRLNSCDPHFF